MFQVQGRALRNLHVPTHTRTHAHARTHTPPLDAQVTVGRSSPHPAKETTNPLPESLASQSQTFLLPCVGGGGGGSGGSGGCGGGSGGGGSSSGGGSGGGGGCGDQLWWQW